MMAISLDLCAIILVAAGGHCVNEELISREGSGD